MFSHGKDEFLKWLEDWDAEFSGWDFSYLEATGRMAQSPLSWNYFNEIKPYCEKGSHLLDMGTGGGEFLSLLPFLPDKVEVTEGYAPNIEVAKKRLEPKGIKVHPVDNPNSLPLPSQSFDIIINRHEGFSADEVYRLLQSGGFFLTQQVGGINGITLNYLLGAGENDLEGWNGQKASEALMESGFVIRRRLEDQGFYRFYDIGSVIYYLKAIPWQIPNFKLEEKKEALFRIHKYIKEVGYVDIVCSRFFLIAQKIK